ncbi:MAG: hypothetical protein R3Y58_02065 [Eubacteriales bacterium]
MNVKNIGDGVQLIKGSTVHLDADHAGTLHLAIGRMYRKKVIQFAEEFSGDRHNSGATVEEICNFCKVCGRLEALLEVNQFPAGAIDMVMEWKEELEEGCV